MAALLALAGALAWTSPVAAPAPMASAPTAAMPGTDIVWTSGDGTAFKVRVPAGPWQAFQDDRERRLAAERERLRSLAGTMIALEAADTFRGIAVRIPEYTDWVYGWLESYVAAYLVLEQTTARWLGIGGYEAVPLRTALSQGFREIVSRRFDQIVVAPAGIDEALQAGAVRAGTTLRDEWRRLVASDRRALDAFVARNGVAAAPIAGPAPACEAAATELPLLQATAAATDRLEPDQTDLFTMRLARPFAARIGIIGMRLAGGGGVFAAAGAFGLSLGGGPVATYVTATAMIWSLDYMVNEVDAISHRGEFEERLITALAETQGQITDEIRASGEGLIDRAHAALLRCTAAAGPEVARRP